MMPEEQMASEVSESMEGMPQGIAALLAQAGDPARARPVERWDPPYCGEIDMHVAADGTWHYRGGPIGREALVRLFASILRREPDGRYVLVTPVEKVGIVVEDAPFLAVEMAVEGEGKAASLTFRTNVGDIVTADSDHPLRFDAEIGTGGVKPYLRVRGGLEALLARSVTHQLLDRLEHMEGRPGIRSAGSFFPIPETAIG